MRLLTRCLCLSLVLAGWCFPGLCAEPAPDRWEKTIAGFEEQDREKAPMLGANLFVGSSTIRLWNLKEAFPDRVCLNRGFGGSQLADVVKYADRIVIPYRPRVIVLYAGDNDLASGRTPEQVRDDYRAFVTKVHAALPETKIVWIAIKPSIARWKIRDKGQAANDLVRAEIAAGTNQQGLNFWDAMLGDNGEPRPELFVKDGLHLSPAGYKIWNERVHAVLVQTP